MSPIRDDKTANWRSYSAVPKDWKPGIIMKADPLPAPIEARMDWLAMMSRRLDKARGEGNTTEMLACAAEYEDHGMLSTASRIRKEVGKW